MKVEITIESMWNGIKSLPLVSKKKLFEKLYFDIIEQAKEETISKQEILNGIESGLKDMHNGKYKTFEQFMKDWQD